LINGADINICVQLAAENLQHIPQLKLFHGYDLAHNSLLNLFDTTARGTVCWFHGISQLSRQGSMAEGHGFTGSLFSTTMQH